MRLSVVSKQSFLSHMPLTLYKTFAWQTFASLRLFTCLVYVSTYCVPIAHLRQNKPFPLLYLGHAQIIISFVRLSANFACVLHASSIAIVSIAFALFNLCWNPLSCYQEPDYNQELSVAYDFCSSHLRLKFCFIHGL